MAEEKGGTATKSAPTKKPRKPLPLWKVLLHNDPNNTFVHVIQSIVNLTPLAEQDAKLRTEEAHKTGVSLLLVTHKERAELYQDQFQSLNITITIEPTE